ncbi:C45 family autoproteolytic acyltransferase/hydrolase [Marinifilum sp. RC60d5]|uniref:C45 family autoproteolytic acyltransferase/hydolase n=1 Tax=Marinifilum sp. RC60d5 TaxID=3458414 RepID=UPI004036487D
MNIKKIVLISIYLLSSLLLFSQEYSYKEKNGVRTFHEGSVFTKEGVPFLTVKGESYEMGLQYGVLMKDQILKLDVKIDSIVESFAGKFFLKKWIANKVLKAKIRKIEKRMPKEFIEELEGMAEGCELNLREVKTIAYFPQLFFDISCTSFVLKNEHEIVHGRNLDWPNIEIFTHYPLIVNYHRKGKIPTSILTFVSYPGAYTGMNHNGLSMSINMNDCPVPEGKKSSDYNTDMPIPYKLRQVMENADELSEVDELFKNYSTHAWFITVGSKKDHSGAIYELTRGEFIKNEMKNNMIAVTNLSLSDKGRYKYSPINMHGDSNIARENKLKELNKKWDNKDLTEKAYQMISSTEYYHLQHDPYYIAINNDMTVKSCIMDNTNNKIYFSYAEQLAGLGQFLEYDISTQKISLFKEAKTSQTQIDLNSKLAYYKWYRKNLSKKKKHDNKYYLALINYAKNSTLEAAYKYKLIANCYTNIKNQDKALEFANKYIENRPKYNSAYTTKINILNNFEDYKAVISTIDEMLEHAILSPADQFYTKIDLLKAYDKLQSQTPEQKNIKEIKQLAKEIKEEANKYFLAKWIKKDLSKIDEIVTKYN